MKSNKKDYCPILKSHICKNPNLKCNLCQLFIQIVIKPHQNRYKIFDLNKTKINSENKINV